MKRLILILTILVITVAAMQSCTVVPKQNFCPTNDRYYFYKVQGIQPFRIVKFNTQRGY
jgi:hypothetical protein